LGHGHGFAHGHGPDGVVVDEQVIQCSNG
jgi:hypothetical protein